MDLNHSIAFLLKQVICLLKCLGKKQARYPHGNSSLSSTRIMSKIKVQNRRMQKWAPTSPSHSLAISPRSHHFRRLEIFFQCLSTFQWSWAGSQWLKCMIIYHRWFLFYFLDQHCPVQYSVMKDMFHIWVKKEPWATYSCRALECG